MNKQELKRAILGALATKLEKDCLLDGAPNEQELIVAMQAQDELAKEFRRRASGQRLSDDWCR